MTLKALSSTQADIAVGQQWLIAVDASEFPALAITLPDGSTLTPVVEFEQDSITYPLLNYGYMATYVPATAGRHIASVTLAGTGESLTFQAWATAVTANTGLPDTDDLDAYLGGAGAHSWEVEELQDALDAESAAQRRVCRIPAAYPADLRQALLRRAAVNLAMRRQLTDLPREDVDFPTGAAVVPPGRDREVRRFEAPFRKITVG